MGLIWLIIYLDIYILSGGWLGAYLRMDIKKTSYALTKISLRTQSQLTILDSVVHIKGERIYVDFLWLIVNELC